MLRGGSVVKGTAGHGALHICGAPFTCRRVPVPRLHDAGIILQKKAVWTRAEGDARVSGGRGAEGWQAGVVRSGTGDRSRQQAAARPRRQGSSGNRWSCHPRAAVITTRCIKGGGRGPRVTGVTQSRILECRAGPWPCFWSRRAWSPAYVGDEAPAASMEGLHRQHRHTAQCCGTL